MIVQAKQQNQPHRECLYAWYPEAIGDTRNSTSLNPRDIYLHNGLDKDLLEQKSSTNGFTSAYINSNTSTELVQRYKQSLAPSDRAYHSTETIDEALSPPWALDYEIKRRAPTPNLPSNSTDMSTREEIPRRLKSAPVMRPLPSAAVLTIPEPKFLTTVVPVTTINPSRPKTRASSAKARLNTTVPNGNKQHREIKSAQVSRRKDRESKLSEQEIEQIFKRIYGEKIEQPQQEPPIHIIYTQPQSLPPTPPAPVYVYQKSASWCADDISSPSPPIRKSIEVSAIPLNPHYLHRPGVIAVNNIDKRSVVRDNSASKKSTKHYRRYHHSHGKRNEPLLALTPMPQKSRISLEIDGVKLTYDSKITLDDKSSNLTKYFIDGRLYLIKGQRYNIINNVNPSSLEKYNQKLIHPQRQKYYQTVPVENFEIPKSSSETYFYNTSPKHLQRYVVDPNFISENLNVNRMSLSKRPPTAPVYA